MSVIREAQCQRGTESDISLHPTQHEIKISSSNVKSCPVRLPVFVGLTPLHGLKTEERDIAVRKHSWTNLVSST